jgi:L,D-transpeptidase YcbB
MPSRTCHKSSLTRMVLLAILAIGNGAPALSQPATDAGPASRAFFPQSSGPGLVTGTLPAPQPEGPGAEGAPVRTTPPPQVRAPVRFVPPPSRATPRPATPWDGLPAFDNATAQRIDAAIPRIAAIVASGGWPRLEPTARLAEGQRTASTETLRRRLEIEGDLSEAGADRDMWDAALSEGLRRFQLRHGLSPTGSIGVLTRRALGVSAEQRLNALSAVVAGLPNVFLKAHAMWL